MTDIVDRTIGASGEFRDNHGIEEGRPQRTLWLKAPWIRTVLTWLLGLAVAIGVWEFVAVVGHFGTYILPAPANVADVFTSRAASVLWPNLLVTFEEVMIGLAGALVVGVILALAVYASKVARRIVNPLLAASQAVPKVAIAPIFVIWFGLGTLPRDIMAGLLAVFPITISTLIGFEALDNDLVLLLRASGSSALRSFMFVRLPAALPSFLGGLKVGVTLAVTGAVLAEFIAGSSGIGVVITTAQGQVETSLAFAGIIVVSVLGIILFGLVELVEVLALRARR